MRRVFLNGNIVDEEQARVPLQDRGLLYGDGLFETLRVRDGQPVWWERHLARLSEGAAFLQIRVPFSSEELRAATRQLIQDNAAAEAVLRVTLTRGVGARGYSLKGASQPMIALTLHPVPPALASARLVTSSFRVWAADPLAPYKTANRLLSILARAQAEEKGADEALFLNADGHLAEATAHNVFWIERGTVCTPPVSAGALAGIARGVVLEICRDQGWRAQERLAGAEVLLGAEGVFLTNSVAGIVPVVMLDERRTQESELVPRLQERLETKRAESTQQAGVG